MSGASKVLYSVTDSLRAGSGQIATKPIPPKPVTKKPTPTTPTRVFGDDVRETLLRKAITVADEWSRRPLTSETIHSAVAEVLDLFDGARGMVPLSTQPRDEKDILSDVWRDGRMQQLPVGYKASFSLEHIKRDYQRLRETAANLQVKEDE